jgi:predicted DCC family thiol-disulfide oxidoreductase YuxK
MSAWRFKLLYDGACPFCVREIKWLTFWNRRGRLAFEDISAPGFDAARYATTREALMQAMHGVYPDGHIVRALEAFREAYRLVGLGWLLAPTRWPGLRPLFDLLYRLFARYRMPLGSLFGQTCTSGACSLRHSEQKRIA